MPETHAFAQERIHGWPAVGAFGYLARLMTSSLPQPKVIITHEADLDGFVSGLLLKRLAKRLFDKDIRLQAYNYDIWRNRHLNEKSAWVCDLSFEPRLDINNWVIIDHHDVLERPTQAKLIHDSQKSAGLLCYELCKEQGLGNEKLDRLVHLNNVADLFLQDDPDFEEAIDYANIIKSYGFWNMLALTEGDLESLIEHPLLEVIRVKRRVEDPLGFAWCKENIDELSPEVGLVNMSVGNINGIVHELLRDESVKYTTLATMFRKGNGNVLISFRSLNEEALPIARLFDGGGHPNACGATLPRTIGNVREGVAYVKEMLNPKEQKRDAPLNSLESLFDAADSEVKKS